MSKALHTSFIVSIHWMVGCAMEQHFPRHLRMKPETTAETKKPNRLNQMLASSAGRAFIALILVLVLGMIFTRMARF